MVIRFQELNSDSFYSELLAFNQFLCTRANHKQQPSKPTKFDIEKLQEH